MFFFNHISPPFCFFGFVTYLYNLSSDILWIMLKYNKSYSSICRKTLYRQTIVNKNRGVFKEVNIKFCSFSISLLSGLMSFYEMFLIPAFLFQICLFTLDAPKQVTAFFSFILFLNFIS